MSTQYVHAVRRISKRADYELQLCFSVLDFFFQPNGFNDSTMVLIRFLRVYTIADVFLIFFVNTFIIL